MQLFFANYIAFQLENLCKMQLFFANYIVFTFISKNQTEICQIFEKVKARLPIYLKKSRLDSISLNNGAFLSFSDNIGFSIPQSIHICLSSNLTQQS